MKLCTLTDVKTLLGITDTVQDDMLDLLIRQESALICAYLGFNPALNEYTDELQAVNNQQLLALNNRPVRNVSKVMINGEEIADYKVLPQYAKIGYLYRGSGWSGSWYTRGMTYDPVAGAYDISVTYTAGWDLPGDAGYVEGGEGSLPFDIVTACIEAVAERFSVASAGAQGIKSHSEGGISTTFEGSESLGGGGLSKRVMGMLEPYKMVGVA